MPAHSQHPIARLRAAAELLDVHLDPGLLSGDPREQHLLVSAMVLLAAERNMLLADYHAQQAGLSDTIQHAALTILSLCQDDHAVMEYLTWRYQRDAVTVTNVTPPGHADDELIQATAISSAHATAYLLTLLHGRMCERAQPGSSNPDLPAAASLEGAREALHHAWAQMQRLGTEIGSACDPSPQTPRNGQAPPT